MSFNRIGGSMAKITVQKLNKEDIENTNTKDGYIVPAYHIHEGCKIYLEGQKACLKMEEKLNKVGIETRVGCNLAGMWSIYVISVPEKLIGTSMNF